MATWAVGDLQGCSVEFDALLRAVQFRPDRDRLWLVGDLVNRGPDSLGVMQRVMALPRHALTTVLGNHDLHLLAIVHGGHSPTRTDTFQDLLDAPELERVCAWLREQPLFVRDPVLGFAMAHAGVLPTWTFEQAERLAGEVSGAIRGAGYEQFFRDMYGNEPALWSDQLVGMDRLRIITNVFTRMRMIDAQSRLDFAHKGTPTTAAPGLRPWFDAAPRRGPLLFGHWAALGRSTGREDIIALDTGCVWGRELSAYCLESGAWVRVAAQPHTSDKAAPDPAS
jgi:bis(5'-nucleosyl)-tetraphosphatase (symmetrical)